ncbi:MAG: non-ribosomal peptide synthetase [Ruminococcus sp.]|nr:non-ribosomal peptide synthetase [Ruminococcus sp.]
MYNTKMNEQRDVISVFHETAGKYTDKTAIASADISLTYKQLDEESSRIASMLISSGIKNEDIIAIFADRSAATITAILGILKAGGAYLPIDILLPDERIESMLINGRAGAVINSCLARQSTRDIIVKNKIIDIDISQSRNFSPAPVNNRISGNSLSYIIFTSGSEGDPKGVMIEDRGIIRLVFDQDYFPISSSWNILQSGTISFDASTFDIFGALLNGATLFLSDQEMLLSTEKLKDTITNKHIDMMFLTTPLFHQHVNVDPTVFSGMKCLITGGDILPVRDAERILESLPSLHFFNAYGPTENTSFSTLFEVKLPVTDNIPIGKAISHSTAYILDENGKEAENGETGELYLGGEGVGRGYINSPELTAEKFLPDPFTGGMMYKTGDLAKWDENGDILFMGRADSQIKLRGFRIELREIINAINSCSGVADSFVMCDTTGGEKNIIAFVKFTAEENTHSLRDELKTRLPSYMIPVDIIPVRNMPLKLNGKVDSAQLLEYRKEVMAERARNSSGNRITDILNSQLNTVVGLDDDLYELGLDSLSAIRVSAELKKMGYPISLKDMFMISTARELTELIEKKQ